MAIYNETYLIHKTTSHKYILRSLYWSNGMKVYWNRIATNATTNAIFSDTEGIFFFFLGSLVSERLGECW
mgnify:CR=1 FL=1